jgi:hypothetical protein
MAKISARGDVERWRFRNEAGAELVYTSRGRLLLKAVKGGSYTLLRPNAGEQTVLDQAARRGMERV